MKPPLTPFCLLTTLIFLLGGPHGAYPQQPDADVAEAAQKHAWEECKAALEAKGEHLDIGAFIPPPVPDDKNFALTPLLKPLLDYTGAKDPKTGEYVLRDPDAPVKKIVAKIPGTSAVYPIPKIWMTGRARPLELWQAYYRASLPGLGLSKSPAEDILTVFGQYDGMFAELRREMLARPLCRYPLHYEWGTSMPLPHLSVLHSMFTVLSLRASAELETNRPDDAFADLEFGFRLIDTFRDEPTLIDGLVRITALTILMQPIWEGIASHHWNEKQLASLEAELKNHNILSDFNRSMRCERAGQKIACDELRKDPKASLAKLADIQVDKVTQSDTALRTAYYSNQILINTMIQEKFLGIVDAEKQIVSMSRMKEAEIMVDNLKSASPPPFLARITMPVYASVAFKFAQIQTYLNEGAIACEIERYRLAHGKLPASLDALQMPDLPHDIINGQPLHYLVTGDDYLLYSVGKNEKDDGGAIVLKPNSVAFDFDQGDLVWSLKPL